MGEDRVNDGVERVAGGRFTRQPSNPEWEARRRAGIIEANAKRRANAALSALAAATRARAEARGKAASEAMETEQVVASQNWTHAKRTEFLNVFAETGNAAHAARHVELTPSGFYHLRSTDELFAAAWRQAKEQYDESARAQAIHLALNGLRETVVTIDGVKTTTRHSDKLVAGLIAERGGVAPGPAAEVVAAARVPGKAGEEARLWLEGEIARIAEEMEAELRAADQGGATA